VLRAIRRRRPHTAREREKIRFFDAWRDWAGRGISIGRRWSNREREEHRFLFASGAHRARESAATGARSVPVNRLTMQADF
jgi:hypothetical protein